MILQDFFVLRDTTSSSFILRTNFSFIFALVLTYWRVLYTYLYFKLRLILKVNLFFNEGIGLQILKWMKNDSQLFHFKS